MKKVLLSLFLLGSLLAGDIILKYNPDSVRVVDGDTITVDLNMTDCPKFMCVKFPIRIDNIDTAEIHSKDANELKYALMAKEEMSNFVNRGPFTIVNCKRDNYFRADCDLKDKDGNLYSEYILSKQLAISYHGDHKVYDWSKHEIK